MSTDYVTDIEKNFICANLCPICGYHKMHIYAIFMHKLIKTTIQNFKTVYFIQNYTLIDCIIFHTYHPLVLSGKKNTVLYIIQA